MWQPIGGIYIGSEVDRASVARQELLPDIALAPFVRCYWQLQWNPASELRQLVLPKASVYISFEKEPGPGRHLRAKLVFPRKQATNTILEGTKTLSGIEFRPGGFFPAWSRGLASLEGQVLPLRDLFPAEADNLESAVFQQRSLPPQARLFDDFLVPLAPAPPHEHAVVREIVATVVADDSIVRVTDLLTKFQISETRLQRLFNKFVGVSPKLLIRTHRFQNAIAATLSGGLPNWAELAYRLGYSDQAHFIKEFKGFTGYSPSELGPGSSAGFLQYTPSDRQ